MTRGALFAAIIKSRKRLRRKRSAKPSLDRINSLPDHILCNILSYLPIKLAASTSLVARRWRFLWTHVTNIDFSSGCHYVDFGEDGQATVPEIVNKVLRLHDGRHINTFRLPLKDNFSEYELGTWISTAIACHVKVLELYLDVHCRLPHCLFNSKTLVELTLHKAICSHMPGDVCLPKLNELNLYYVEFESEGSLPNLISGCLVLEDLFIEGNIFSHDNMFYCNLSSHTLKRLTLDFPQNDKDWSELSVRYLVELSIPTLQYLSLTDYSWRRLSVRPPSTLVEAKIQLDNDFVIEEKIIYSRSLFELAESFSNVKSLTFSSEYRMVVFDASFSIATTKFHNLTKLELDADWCFLTKFLEIADNLQDLIIVHVNGNRQCWREPEHVPVCLLSSLKTVKVVEYECKDQEFEMVSYILKNAKFLERMEICCDEVCNLRSKFNMLQKISLCERGSKTCSVSFD